MTRKIHITIPDDLSPIEEMSAIGKALGKNLLPSRRKVIGEGYTIEHLRTEIVIERKPIEKPIILLDCTVCGKRFDRAIGSRIHTNYGGVRRTLIYCSQGCAETVLAIGAPGRIERKPSLLSRVTT